MKQDNNTMLVDTFVAPQCININLDSLHIEEVRITYKGVEYKINIDRALQLVGEAIKWTF